LAVYLLWIGVNNSRTRLRPGQPNFLRWRLIFANPVWNLLHITRLEPRILRWLLGYRKICALLAVDVALRTYSKYSRWHFLLSSNTSDLVQAYMNYLSLVLWLCMCVMRRLAENVCIDAVEYFEVWLERSVLSNIMTNSW